MSVIDAIVLGIVQGLTEFFPVSSSGHLVMTESVLGLRIPGISFDIALHVATLLSVLMVYHRKILELFGGLLRRGERSTLPYVGKLVVATIPAGLVGVLFQDWFEARFDDPIFAGTMVLVTGSLVWSTRWGRREGAFALRELLPVVLAGAVAAIAGTWAPFLAVLAVQGGIMAFTRTTAPSAWHEPPGWGGAALMGIAQAVAILPGGSRSGSTVGNGLWRRIDPVAAAEFSFLMSVPAILGAAVLHIPDALAQQSTVGVAPMGAGVLAAASAGVLAIRFFVALLRKQNFHVFAYYCWLVGAAFVLFGG
ncbi:MAG: undecaprenyl-diphosphate phosphatase [Gemmatimonadetes bacterium]|nr:undecaprenyl-diphosphate phosphatase [Gemmatimonadota bacterium]